MKRHIAIPLLCVVLVAALSFSVYATSINPSFPYPENNLSGMGIITGSVESYPNSLTFITDLSYGNMKVLKFGPVVGAVDTGATDYLVSSVLNFTLNVSRADSFYIAVSNDELVSTLSSIASYEDPSLSYNVDFGDDWPLEVYSPNFSTQKWVITNSTGPVNVHFIGYKNVPAGEYTISQDLMTNVDHNIVFGVYGSAASGTSVIFDDYMNGNLSYTDALVQLNDYFDELVSDDVYQNILYATEYQNAVLHLNGLASSSAADKATALDSDMQSTVDQFADGTLDLKSAMDTLSGDFSSALAGAQTVEEAQAVTTVYQANLKLLEVQNQIHMMIALDDAISDDELATMNDYYAAEYELVNAFDVADFDAQLQFDLWFLQMPKNETIEYKKFFDYLMNESDIKYFITIPLAMSLIAIIMGTRMRTKGDRDRSPDISHSWTGEGSAYHNNDK